MITIERAPNDEPTFRVLLDLLLELHTHVGMAPINPDKLARSCYEFLSEGMTFLARAESGDKQGEIVGSLCLVWGEHYYSDWRFLHDKWFYVKPAYRVGRAGVKLLLAARSLAISHQTAAFIMDTNRTHKRNRSARLERELRELGFVSAGYVLRLQALGKRKGILTGENDGHVHQQDVIDDVGSRLRL